MLTDMLEIVLTPNFLGGLSLFSLMVIPLLGEMMND